MLAAFIPGASLFKPKESEYKELVKTEVFTARYNWAKNPKYFGKLMSDYEVLTKIMKYPGIEATEILASLKAQRQLRIQKLEELKLEVMAQNPSILGVFT
jgi:hypothetical protein